VFTDPLPSNESPIVACACIAGMCLPTRCLAIGIHVALYMYIMKRVPRCSDRNYQYLSVSVMGSNSDIKQRQHEIRTENERLYCRKRVALYQESTFLAVISYKYCVHVSNL
jgi:hypothetical protein